MYMKKNIVEILFLCCFLTSCLGVYYDDLGNRYAWIEGREIVKIKEETENYISYEVLIRPQVLNYAYDDIYIIVYQVYDGSESYLVPVNQMAEEKDSLFKQFAMLKEMKHCYWIINKETGQVTGPMRKADFGKKCKELHVKAKMRNIYEEKFRKGMSIYIEHIDSVKRRNLENIGTQLYNTHE